jgi:hypothetical protein
LPQRVQVDDLMDLPVVQQPAGHPTYVSRGANQATQFSLAAMHDTVGLLAHNTLAGKFFSRLAIGEQVRLLYGDGRVEAFVITEILRFQALEPLNPTSDLRSLATGEVLSAAEVFDRVYTGAHHLTLQTCIARLGITSWGRLFVIAMPAEAPG